jgi:CheY-like chemotaxis protein
MVFGHDSDQIKAKKKQFVTRYTVSEVRKSKLRILIVEDNIINQKLTLRLLEKSGFQADIVANGQEAVKALVIAPYDLVLMDVQMPLMDGLEATRIIRDKASKVKDHNIPIIAMTAHAMQGDKDECLQAGMNDYVSKPIQPHELFDSIERQIADQGPANALIA